MKWICCLVILSCGPADNIKSPANASTKDTKEKIVFGQPYVIDSSAIVIIPVAREEETDNGKLLDIGSYSKGGGGYSNFFRSGAFKSPINNLIFYNQDTRKTYLLGETKYHIVYVDDIDLYGKRRLLYEMITEDLNGDNFLTHADQIVLFVSELDGSGLKSISPIHEKIWSWKIDRYDHCLIVETKTDTDSDKKITDADRTLYYRINWPDDTIEKIVPEDIYYKVQDVIK